MFKVGDKVYPPTSVLNNTKVYPPTSVLNNTGILFNQEEILTISSILLGYSILGNINESYEYVKFLEKPTVRFINIRFFKSIKYLRIKKLKKIIN